MCERLSVVFFAARIRTQHFLAQRMGGSVGAFSELGKGSQFYVNLTLPIPQEYLSSTPTGQFGGQFP